jgi:zinc transporter ZupT
MPAADTEFEEQQNCASIAKSLQKRKVVGYLNLVADGVHNFTDGAAIGVSDMPA